MIKLLKCLEFSDVPLNERKWLEQWIGEDRLEDGQYLTYAIPAHKDLNPFDRWLMAQEIGYDEPVVILITW